MPGMEWLVEGGMSGNLTTMEPQLSPMLWTSIATGKRAGDHGVHGFTEVDPASGRVVPVTWASRRCKTIWEILGERGLRTHVVGWFATQGERLPRGCMVSNLASQLHGIPPDTPPEQWPGLPKGSCFPDDLAADISRLRVSPYELDPEQILRLFVPLAHEADQTADPRIFHLAEHLAEAFSVHAHAVHVMEKEPDWDFAAIYYRPLDEICHRFMPYHPPRMAGVPERDFRLYQDVVNSTYRLYDLFLRRMLQIAGEDAAVMVVSDHGFRSGHLRPQFTPDVPAGITVWHRPQGVFAARGPGLLADELVFGARLLDVAPTILHYFGLPPAADMEGRVLNEVFISPQPLEPITTYEDPEAIARERLPLEDNANRAILDHFTALGYLAETASDLSEAARQTRTENNWNLARAYMDAGRAADALPLLQQCLSVNPQRTDYAQLLATCQLHLDLFDEAEGSIRQAVATFGSIDRAQQLQASIALQRNQPTEAVVLLEQIGGIEMNDPGGLLLLARAYVELRRWDEAADAAKRSIALDPDNPGPYLALVRQLIHRKRYAEAAEYALTAIALDFPRPNSHYLLGVALAADGKLSEAAQSLYTCLRFAPGFLRALRLLGGIHVRMGDTDRADACQQQLWYLTARKRVEPLPVQHQSPAKRQQAPQASINKAQSQPPDVDNSEEKEFLLVSGLPRSGTSLMMQILDAAGIPVLTDQIRSPDADNPRGYWEWEGIKQLPANPFILDAASGHAVKVISALLASLPVRHRYKIIYMVRPLAEVVESQCAMLARQGKSPGAEKQHLIGLQQQHSGQIRAALRRSKRVRLLEVEFPALIADPVAQIARIAEFVGDGFHNRQQAQLCIQPALHRQRSLP